MIVCRNAINGRGAIDCRGAINCRGAFNQPIRVNLE